MRVGRGEEWAGAGKSHVLDVSNCQVQTLVLGGEFVDAHFTLKITNSKSQLNKTRLRMDQDGSVSWTKDYN